MANAEFTYSDDEIVSADRFCKFCRVYVPIENTKRDHIYENHQDKSHVLECLFENCKHQEVWYRQMSNHLADVHGLSNSDSDSKYIKIISLNHTYNKLRKCSLCYFKGVSNDVVNQHIISKH